LELRIADTFTEATTLAQQFALMPTSNDIFAAFLKCETKAYLYAAGQTGERSEFINWHEHLKDEFRQNSRERLGLDIPAEESFVGTPSLLTLKERRYRVIMDYEATAGGIRSLVHALVQIPEGPRKTSLPIVQSASLLMKRS
jgi:hypothetical protein